MSDTIEAVVYFDYLCPFAYRGVQLFTEMQRTRPNVHVMWRHFPLEQVNAKDENWKLWEQPLDYETIWDDPHSSRALRAFLASHAASLQGEEAFACFRLALFSARHDQKKSISDPEVILDAARQAELDLDAFTDNWQSQEARDRLRDDYLSGREVGAFGVPTLVINGCESTYMRIINYPPAEERDTFFDELVHLLTSRPYLQELKRASAQ
ncbi:MAG: DsbA family protein [Anaerolineae bacterium]